MSSALSVKLPISLCMIAKNEEHCITEAIQSVAAIVSEIILVDTGSTDNTVGLAKQFGAQVISDEWRDDFSVPRNISIDAASQEWILVLDADELIDTQQHALIAKLVEHKESAFLFTQRHYTNDHRLSNFHPCSKDFSEYEKNYTGYFESKLCRLFPNTPHIRYENRIHELVEPSILRSGEYKLFKAPVILHHYGHTPEAKLRKNKTKLYTPLGQQKIEEQPENWKSFYELAVEHNCNGRAAESVFAFQRAAELNPEHIPTWINFGYVLTELERYTEAFTALFEALKRSPKHPEAHCNIAVVYMRLRDYAKAEVHLRQAIKSKPDYLNAYSNLGSALMKLGRVSEASRAFQAGYKKSPGNTRLLCVLAQSLLEVGIIDEAKNILQEIVKIDPTEPSAWYLFAQTLRQLELPIEAKLAQEKYLSLIRDTNS